MTLLLISHGYPPVSHSGVFRAASFAKYLSDLGIRVVVLTASEPLESVMQYPDKTSSDGVEVVRVPFADTISLRTKSIENFALRVPAFPGVTKNRRLLRMAKSIWERASAVRDFSDIDGVLATSPPPATLVLGAHIAGRLHVPLWSDIRDPWTYGPGVKYRTWFDFWVEKQFER